MDGLQLADVTHKFGDLRVVDGVDLHVRTGEVVCLLGPSGCGKTTTLRIAAGLETLQHGRVAIAAREVARPGWQLPPEARGVGMMFQDYALFPHLTVAENVAFGLPGLTAAERRSVADGLLVRLNMAGRAEVYPHTLSGGEQQRVALARAMAPKPGVMLLDEPFASLDVRLRDAVRDDTLSVLKEADAATLLVTHDPEEAMRMADRVAVMRDGQIVQDCLPDEAYHQPANRFVAEFFGEVNVIPSVVAGAGQVSTPLGALPAPGSCNGTEVEVLARLEAVQICDGGPGARAQVVTARSLGAYGMVEMRLESDGTRLRSRVARRALPQPGTTVTVRLDEKRAFVFTVEAT